MYYKYKRADDFINVPRPDFHAYSGNLILYGAGVNGLIASVLLRKMGVDFICFADSDEKKWGTEYMGKPVISPQELKECCPDTAILVTPYHFRPIYPQLREMGFTTLFDCLHLFLEFDMEDVDKLLPDRYYPGQLTISVNNYMRKLHEYYVCGVGNYRSLAICTTEKCTLRCKHCQYFMPYFKSPKDRDYNELCTALDRLLGSAHFAYVNVEGGELFLYKHLAGLIDKLVSFENVDLVHPFTNATILPNERVLQSLRSKKVIVRISNYGDNSRKLNELVNVFEHEGIAYNVMSQQWHKLELNQFNRTQKDHQNVYESCCKFLGDPILAYGRLYRCGFAAHVESLGVLPHSPEDSVDLMEEPYTKEALHEKLDAFYTNAKYIQACKYCSGRGHMSEKIPVAEQMTGNAPELPKYL